MSLMTHPIISRVRTSVRKLGLTRLAVRLFYTRNYEDRFSRRMLETIKLGDCVWDVGANVGLYSRKFADRVGDHGRVIAFEPSPANLLVLGQALRDRSNVVIMPVALGSRKGTLKFQQGADAMGATSKCLDPATSGSEQGIDVEVMRGDELADDGRVRLPNVIKIDTEGFELDVLDGCCGLLCKPELRTLCIEVHFDLLEARGLKDAPRRIEKLLVSAGFRVTWPDVSHIVASRKRA